MNKTNVLLSLIIFWCVLIGILVILTGWIQGNFNAHLWSGQAIGGFVFAFVTITFIIAISYLFTTI